MTKPASLHFHSATCAKLFSKANNQQTWNDIYYLAWNKKKNWHISFNCKIVISMNNAAVFRCSMKTYPRPQNSNQKPLFLKVINVNTNSWFRKYSGQSTCYSSYKETVFHGQKQQRAILWKISHICPKVAFEDSFFPTNNSTWRHEYKVASKITYSTSMYWISSLIPLNLNK